MGSQDFVQGAGFASPMLVERLGGEFAQLGGFYLQMICLDSCTGISSY